MLQVHIVKAYTQFLKTLIQATKTNLTDNLTTYLLLATQFPVVVEKHITVTLHWDLPKLTTLFLPQKPASYIFPRIHESYGLNTYSSTVVNRGVEQDEGLAGKKTKAGSYNAFTHVRM